MTGFEDSLRQHSAVCVVWCLMFDPTYLMSHFTASVCASIIFPAMFWPDVRQILTDLQIVRDQCVRFRELVGFRHHEVLPPK